jgi:hypothetical protein
MWKEGPKSMAQLPYGEERKDRRKAKVSNGGE